MSLSPTSRALLLACYEYLLITVPVGMYIALEATHAKQFRLLWTTPEWAMATIFLLFQGVSLYIRLLSASGKRVSSVTVGLIALISLVFIAITLLNAYLALEPSENTRTSIGIRLSLFLLVSVLFGLFVGGAKLYQIKGGKANGQDA